MSCICKKKVERNDIKIQCSDCKNHFHASCVNVLPDDLDFMKKNRSIWRCVNCTSLRRASFSAENPLPLSNKHAKSDVGIIEKEINKPPTVITIEMVFNEIKELKKLNQECLSKISVLQTENLELKTTVSVLQERINRLEQSKLCDSIEIVNVPNVDSSTALHTALKIVRDGVGVDLDEREISNCFVKQIKTTNNPTKPHLNILSLKFTHHLTKEKIMRLKNKKKQRLTTKLLGDDQDGSQMYINDSLTSHMRALFNATKKIKTEKKFKFIWMRNSIIFLRKNEGDSVIKVRCFEDLDNFKITQ